MLVNSFLPLVTLALGSYTVKLPNRTENGVKLTAKTVSLKYTGIFLKGQSNKMFILKSESNEAVLMPTIEKIKDLPCFDLSKSTYNDEIPSDVIVKINELFSSVHNDLDGVSPIGLYLSGFISDDLLHDCVKKYLTAYNAAVDNQITISKADCIKYASMALAAQQGLIHRENETSVISLNDRIKQLKASKDRLAKNKIEKTTETVGQNKVDDLTRNNKQEATTKPSSKPRKPSVKKSAKPENNTLEAQFEVINDLPKIATETNNGVSPVIA